MFGPWKKPLHAVEEEIEEAIARGDFDNLEGKGRPLKIWGDLSDRATMSTKLRRDANFGAPWEDVGREIEVLTERAARDLRRALASGAALGTLESQIREINSLILKHNLLLPPQLPALYRVRLTPEALEKRAHELDSAKTPKR